MCVYGVQNNNNNKQSRRKHNPLPVGSVENNSECWI